MINGRLCFFISAVKVEISIDKTKDYVGRFDIFLKKPDIYQEIDRDNPVWLAEKLGVKANTISNYEKEVTAPDFKVLVKLCKLFRLPTDMMLNNLLTASDLEALPDWLKNVRQNFQFE